MEYERKLAAREAARDAGKKSRGKQPEPPSAAPGAKDQFNFTDPESRIVPVSGGGFEQCDNAQAAVEVESRLIVGQRVRNAPNDKPQLVPSLGAIAATAGPVQDVLIDSGFLSGAAVQAVGTRPDGTPSGVRVLAALGRARRGRRVADLEKKADPPEPASDAPWAEQMAYRIATKAGRTRHRLRQQTVEPTAPNPLAEHPKPTAPNQVWVSDICQRPPAMWPALCQTMKAAAPAGELGLAKAEQLTESLLHRQSGSRFLGPFKERKGIASGGGRTHNLCLRRAALYPVELRMREFGN